MHEGPNPLYFPIFLLILSLLGQGDIADVTAVDPTLPKEIRALIEGGAEMLARAQACVDKAPKLKLSEVQLAGVVDMHPESERASERARKREQKAREGKRARAR